MARVYDSAKKKNQSLSLQMLTSRTVKLDGMCIDFDQKIYINLLLWGYLLLERLGSMACVFNLSKHKLILF